MGTAEIKSEPRLDRWTLRPGDLPARPAADAPHLQGLEHNAVYRHLIHAHRRHRRQRVFLMAAYLGSWMALGPLYGHFVLGADLMPAIIRTAALLVVLSIGIGNIYVFAGIEGYETNGWLKNRFFDVIATGIPASEIMQGILGKTVSHYPPALVRGVLVLASLALLGLIFQVPVAATTVLFIWLLFLGVFGAFQLIGVLPYLAYITIPGTWLWYRGVRRSYEQRLAERQGRRPSPVMALLGLMLFLTVSISTVLGPILGYLYAGFLLTSRLNLPWAAEHQAELLGAMYVVYALAGVLSGSFWGWLARRTTPARLGRLEAELDRLFKIRGDVLFGG